MKKRSLQRGYLENNVNSAIDKARKVPRAVALRKVEKTVKSEGPIFAVTYEPRLPALGQIQAKHWRSMTSRNKYLGDVFKRPPLIAYKRQQNFRDHLIKAKVPRAPRLYQEKRKNGMKKVAWPAPISKKPKVLPLMA